MTREEMTAPEFMAYVYNTEGAATFKALLDALPTRFPRAHKQLFEGITAELRQVGLVDLAELLDTYAATLPHYWELPNIEPTVSGRHWWTKHCQAYKAEWEAKQNCPASG